MPSNQREAGRRSLPSSVACPGSPGAQPAGTPAAPPEPVPGLLAYLRTKRANYLAVAQRSAFAAADKRCSRFTKEHYEKTAREAIAEMDTLDGLIIGVIKHNARWAI